MVCVCVRVGKGGGGSGGWKAGTQLGLTWHGTPLTKRSHSKETFGGGLSWRSHQTLAP